jgi:hypothetical protein
VLLIATGCARDQGPDAPAPSVAASPSPTGGTAAAACSASGLPSDVPTQDLPAPVASTRAQIVKAATSCDFDALARLALAGSGSFSFSFGAPQGGPGEYWRKLEADREAPLAFLVKVLGVRHATMELPGPEASLGTSPGPGLSGTAYVWPSAHAREVPTDGDWGELERVYPREEVARMKENSRKMGIGYLGWRVGIMASGDWIYFIQGD